VADVAETCRRLALGVAAWVRNVDGPVYSPGAQAIADNERRGCVGARQRASADPVCQSPHRGDTGLLRSNVVIALLASSSLLRTPEWNSSQTISSSRLWTWPSGGIMPVIAR
jgi:hypothetical protein